jgi:hypothetical protein
MAKSNTASGGAGLKRNAGGVTRGEVIEAFNQAGSQAAYKAARRAAARLTPLDQLHIIDALRAAERRLGLG